MFAHNLLTGAGLERVLTTADLSANVVVGSAENQVLRWDVSNNQYEPTGSVLINPASPPINGRIQVTGSSSADVTRAMLNVDVGNSVSAIWVSDRGGDGFYSKSDFPGTEEHVWGRWTVALSSGVVNFKINEFDQFTFEFSSYYVERAAALADILGSGQFWVRNTLDGEPMFTDDQGVDSVLNDSGGQVNSVVSGTNITIDASDPVNPIANLDAAITGVSVNGVTLDATGAATNFLNETGAYSVPPVAPVQELEAPSTSIRMSAENSGIVQVRSDGSTDVEDRLINFVFTNETIRGRIGYVGGPTLEVKNQVHGANIFLTCEEAGGTEYVVAECDPDVNNAGGVGAFTVWEGPAKVFPFMRVWDAGDFATRTGMSTIQMKDAQGVARTVGPINSSPNLFSGNATMTLNDWLVKTRYHDEGITRILDMPSDLDGVASGCMMGVVNFGTGGLQLRPATGLTLEWWDGSAYQTLVGNGTLVITLPTGRFSLWYISESLYEVFGAGIT